MTIKVALLTRFLVIIILFPPVMSKALAAEKPVESPTDGAPAERVVAAAAPPRETAGRAADGDTVGRPAGVAAGIPAKRSASLQTVGGGAHSLVHPNFARGAGADKVIESSDWDWVNLFNGNLSLSVPLGQWYQLREGFGYRLVLHYNSNVWDFSQNSSGVITATPMRSANAGLGWSVSLGRLVDPWAPDNPLRQWVYVEPDGTERAFFATLHADVTEPDDNVFYTRDASYYRLKQTGAATCLVESPDGTVRTFELANGAWRLTRIADRFTNYVSVSYAAANAWTLTDNHGRTQTVHFRADPAGGTAIVDRVVVSAFAGQTATYTFAYTTATVSRPSADNDSTTPATVNLSVLSSVTNPDGTSYAFTYHPAGAGDSSGRAASMRLPTLGKLEWSYDRYSFAGPLCASALAPVYRANVGVARRLMVDSAGTAVGAWLFTQRVKSLGDANRCAEEGEMTNTVMTPVGDKTTYYFSVNARGTSATGWSRSDYGLPLTKDQPESGANRHLSKQVFDCDGAGQNCSLLQSLYVRYEQDTATDPASPLVASTNRREVSHRTYYHDDVENGVPRYAGLEKSNFDGLGHFRRVVTNGNFGGGDARETTVDYNASTGTYPSPGFVMPATNLPWVINIFGRHQTVEGASQRIVEFCYDRDNGFLRRRRTFATREPNGPAGSADVIAVYTPDAAGQVAREQHYGSDVQAVATGGLCSLALPATDQYRIQHTYRYGTLASTQFFTEAGAAFGPRVADRDVDRNTGYVTTSRDTAGLATTYEYDAMARLTWVKPAAGHGAWTQYHRTAADASNQAKTYIYRKQNGTGATLTYKAEIQDSFGRVWWEQTCIPGSCPSRYKHYNAMGWMTHRSEYSNEQPKYTTYWDHDPFGRPRTERPPDGERHDINYEYRGARVVRKTTRVGWQYWPSTGQVEERPRVDTEVYDRQGRKWKVINDETLTTSQTYVYEYDVAGNFLRTTTAAGVQVGSRHDYDPRGFLVSSGDGSRGSSYQQHDAVGRARVQTHHLTPLTYVYDRAGRVTRVQEHANPSKVWKEFTYADANGTNDWRAGKLWQAKRYNYVNTYTTVAYVTETNTYGGKDGRLSRYEVELTDALGSAPEKFAQTYVYDELGNVREVGYPNSLTAGSGNTGRDRRISYTYSSGLPTKVEGTLNGQAQGWADSVAYHANGLVRQVAHSNGVHDNVTSDPDGFVRPASVSTAGVRPYGGRDQNFYSGTFQYDGTGALVRAGGEYFVREQGDQPPTPVPTGLTSPCRRDWQDPFGMIAAYGDAQCNPTTTYFYTAFDKLYKLELNVDNERTWYFYDLNGRTLMEYAQKPFTSQVWAYTRDYIYLDRNLLATDEKNRDSTLNKTTHYHQGFGAKGILTDAAGNRLQ